ncbi:MAG: 3'-5' exonuclease [Kaiparowitsia implicata GSE-PSE-MK54-09C]|jgi:DNA polymerase-3 subunit epsilon|nr:3'-5' exonuclease [Kaiparowitsia implicata GSE-PSE-MK54-09C]
MTHPQLLLSIDLLAFYRQASQQTFTVVDVETTGSRASSSRITELAVVQATLADGIQHQQSTLINPEAVIPPNIVSITGITQAMVADAPTAAVALPQFQPWLQVGLLTAHNLDFDYGFLQAEYERLGVSFMRPTAEHLCTVQLARLMLPHLRSRSLPDLVQHFSFPVNTSHRAEADAIACWLLAERLLTDILQLPDAEILQRFAQQWLSVTDAAHLLGCSTAEGRSHLAAAGITGRTVKRYKRMTELYRRGDVERVIAQRSDGQQLSLFH